jgi:hypothetical protein
MTNKEENQLVLVVKESGLQPSKVETLLQSFAGYFNEAKQLTEVAKAIKVTDETQVALMDKARTIRLQLKKVRVETDKTRIELKAQALREGRAIDGVGNLIKALIVPIEEHLEKQEKYAEFKKLEREEKINSERVTKLSRYVEDVSFYNLKEMTDEAFEELLKSSKTAYEAKEAAEKKAEADRLAKEREEREERERIRAENEQLKKAAEEKERKLEIERKANEKKLLAEQKKREEAEAKLRAEKELKEKKEREELEAREAKAKAEEEDKRRALLAPDKVKLIEYAGLIDKLPAPHVASREAGLVINEVVGKLSELSDYLREKSKVL